MIKIRFMRLSGLGKASAAPLLMGLSLVLASSCVDKKYDLDDVDWNVNVLKGVEIPVGDVQRKYLRDIIFNDDEALVKVDGEGNYFVSLAEGDFGTDIKIPSYSYEGFSQAESVSPEYPGVPVPGLAVSGTADFGSVDIEVLMESDALPTEITALSYCEVESKISLSLRASSQGGIISLKEGTELKLPGVMVLGGSVPGGLRASGKNTFVTTSDIRLAPSVSFDFMVDAIDFGAAPEGEGLVAPGHFRIKAVAGVSGGIVFEDVPASSMPTIEAVLSMPSVKFEKVTARLAKEEAVSVDPIEVSDLPDFLSDDNAVLDMRGLRLDMTIDNSLPVGGSVRTGIRTLKNSSVLSSVELGPVRFQAAPSDNMFSFSEKGSGAPAGFSDVMVDGFDSLVKTVPETVEMRGMVVGVDDEMVEIALGKSYGVKAGYVISSPLAFGPEVNISFDQDFTGFGLDFSDVTLGKALITLDAVSDIPVDFELGAEAIDENGDVINDIEVSVEGKVNAGSLSAPSTSKVTLTLSRASGSLSFDGLRLSMKALSTNTSFVGVPLNEAQSLELRNLVMCVPDGVGFDLGGE